MPSLLHKLFRRAKPGDPLRKVADTRNLNFVYSVLEDIQGMGCRIDKPTGQGGRGWRIVFDGFSDDALPYKPPWQPTCDKDVDQPTTESLTMRDNHYSFVPQSGEPGESGDVCASAVFRLCGFRSQDTSGAGVDTSASAQSWMGMAWGKLSQYDTPTLQYVDVPELIASTICADERTIESSTGSGGSGAWPVKFGLINWGNAQASSIDTDDRLLIRAGRTIEAILPDDVYRKYESSIEQNVSSICVDNADEMLGDLIIDLWAPMRPPGDGMYGAVAGGGYFTLWAWVDLASSYSGLSDFWEMIGEADANISAWNDELEAAESAVSGVDASSLLDDLTSASSELSSLVSSIEDLSSDIDELGSAMTSAMEYLSSASGLIASADVRVSALEGR